MLTVLLSPGRRHHSNPNFATGKEKTEVVFQGNTARLRELKEKYDPGFVFRKWYLIEPAV
ncbi:hypothetical protein BKA61DRAFT_617576 [Leptodontidium sp. MPI-SDFR-AT-0119]|nr:hypothetical protein BKA61DRAFT_617576 [Leptodontidium sp. MPI-SDFR-AT-0119]